MNSQNNPSNFLPVVIAAALEAGDAALAVYEGAFDVTEKADHSPLTLADMRSHEIISAALKPSQIPVLSEEGRDVPYEERSRWPALWIVDPLDGTKEFVKKNGEFTINIALVADNRPVMGVIYVPVTGMLYFAADPLGAFSVSRTGMPPDWQDGWQDGWHDSWHDNLPPLISAAKKLPLEKRDERPYTIMGSRSHATPELTAFVDEMKKCHETVELVPAGSSLKFCRIAEGFADVYPRMGPTMEWDTAAGQVIAEQSGAAVLDYHSRTPLEYNKPDLTNPWFIVERIE